MSLESLQGPWALSCHSMVKLSVSMAEGHLNFLFLQIRYHDLVCVSEVVVLPQGGCNSDVTLLWDAQRGQWSFW